MPSRLGSAGRRAIAPWRLTARIGPRTADTDQLGSVEYIIIIGIERSEYCSEARRELGPAYPVIAITVEIEQAGQCAAAPEPTRSPSIKLDGGYFCLAARDIAEGSLHPCIEFRPGPAQIAITVQRRDH